MKKRINAVWDIFFGIISMVPLYIAGIVIFFLSGIIEGENLYWIVFYVTCLAVPAAIWRARVLIFRHVSIYNNENAYFSKKTVFSRKIRKEEALEKNESNNGSYEQAIVFSSAKETEEINKNTEYFQLIKLSEVENVKTVKLSKEERKTKVNYRHWFNKYLRIKMKDGKYNYVYVGNYSSTQVLKIIDILKSKL